MDEKQGSTFSAMELEHSGDPPLQDDDLVISGMSALMPGCENLKEWAEKLYNKENMVTSENNRWNITHPELSQHHGLIPGIDRFDAQFFMVNHKLSHATDPASRKLLEQAYQALFDAGVSPSELSGKRVGVFIALWQNETEKEISRVAFGLVGCNRTMFANRISYWLNVKGPSFCIDAACSGSVVALEQAHQAILSGRCDSALVGAANLVMHPQTSIHYGRTVPQNFDGKTKCYDINADGQSISEAVSVIYLQKYKDARRVYAQLCHVKTSYSAALNNEFAVNFGHNRDPERLAQFMKDFYEGTGVSPSSVEYVEGFGGAHPDTDKSELQAVDGVFCKDRSSPLLLGSVASNMGFTGNVSGINGIIKILEGYQTGVMAANINCNYPRQDIEAIKDGRIKILTEHHAIRRSYSALNSFSITGIDGHVLLKGNYKKKTALKYCDLPYLVTISSRQESGVDKILNIIKSNDLDPEELGLLREIHKMRTTKHLARGFGVFSSDENKTVTLSEKVDYYDDIKRPLWFVYSGMGTQWVGMGAQLMRIPIFAAAILRCDKVLKPKGINIVDIITTNDDNIFNNILNTFVGITAIQIALTDVLVAVGLTPSKIIGHSMGEVCCAYADKSLTAEETILMAYYRGVVSTQMPFIKGSMAAVGIGYNEVSKLCPPEIEVACHNGPDSSTLSGPADIMPKFIEELREKGIFAKEVNSSNIAYHSRYIAEAGPIFLKLGREVITKPKLRSNRWLSTSVPMDEWKQYDAMYSSAEYFTNNLLKPVLFQETCRMIPNGSVLVEIGPHGLLQAILKRSLPSDCRNIPLTNRGHPDSVVYLLDAIGKLYIEGCDVDTRALYPKIEFPVSTKTRQLSHMVEHYHTDQWNVCRYLNPDRRIATTFKPTVSLYDDEYKYLSGSVVTGTTIFPIAGILMFVWDTMAMCLSKMKKTFSVQFKDLRFYDQPLLKDQCPLELTILMQKQSGRFEVTEDPNHLIAEGYIEAYDAFIDSDVLEIYDEMKLSSADVYKLLFERGYEYTDEFRSIRGINSSLTRGEIAWNKNWITFMDGMLQIISLRQDHDGISEPSCVQRIIIDIKKHAEAISDKDVIEAKHYELGNITRCGGVVIENVILKDKPSQANFNVGFKSLKFVPFVQEFDHVSNNLYVVMQIVAEHLARNFIKILTVNNNPETSVFHEIKHLLCSEPEIKIDVHNVNEEEITNYLKDKPDLVFLNNKNSKKQIFNLLHSLPVDSFLLIQAIETKYINRQLFKSIFVAGNETKLELFQWSPPQKENIVYPIKNTSDLIHLQNLKKDLSLKQSLTVVSTYPPMPGVKNVVKRLRADDHYQVRLAMINSKKSDIDLKKLHNLDLAVNVYENERWGGEYYVPLEEFQTKSCKMTLQIANPGDLSTLQWVEMNQSIDEKGIPITVHYAGINVHDAKRATSEISSKTNFSFGMDFSGLNERKEPIMGLIPEGTACSKINFISGLIWPVPEYWSLEDAATVPLPYCMAFYCLGIKLKLVRGMNVLIHGGAGAIGQAAISIAMSQGCTVFTTVSDKAKKTFLRALFPDLPANHIGNSRDDSFKDMVLDLTKGDGCEIIISDVKRNLKNATLTCCAMAGTTIDLTQIHDHDNYQYGMSFMTKARSYFPVDFLSLFNKDNENELKRLQVMVSEGIARGFVRPLSRVTYEPHEVSRAFRLLAGSRHRGRVLLLLKDQQPITQPRITCLPGFSYLIISDTEGLGLKLVDKLISCGAKKIQLSLPSLDSLTAYKQKYWDKSGAKVIVSSRSPVDDEIEHLVKKLNENEPIDGMFIVQDDTRVTSQATTLLKLDSVSRKMTPSLRYFVIVNGDQIAHQICQKRSHDGFPSASISISLKKFNQGLVANRTRFGSSSAVDVIEKVSLAKEPNVLVYAKQATGKDIIEEVAKIPGVKITSATTDRSTLEKVGIDHGRNQELCFSLKNEFNIKIPEEDIPSITIGQLKKWQLEMKETELKLKQEMPGIGAYFNSIHPDEVIANTELIRMPSLLGNSKIRADEVKIEDNQMFIIPGLEGHHKKLTVLCKRLKIATAVLQLGYDNMNETVQEMAQRFANVILQNSKFMNHFYLMGYDYGVIVALEVAAILESYGMKGTVFCLGGSPEEMRADIENRLNGMSESKVQNILIQHFCSLASDTCLKDLEIELLKLHNFEAKVELGVKRLRGHTTFNTEYLSDVVKSTYARIGIARNYMCNFSLKSDVILIRALPQQVSKIKFTASYDIPVSIANAPDYLGCPGIVNRHLGPHVFEDYCTKNLCVTYLTNNDDFVELGHIVM